MKKIDNILFVCTDNTCRSIMAEAVMKSVCGERKISVGSRGLVVLFPEPLNPKAVAIMTGNQMSPAKASSELLVSEDITDTTLILTMTAREAALAKERFPDAPYIMTLGEFAGKPGDIEEPHGGTLAEYGACYEYIDLLVKLAAESFFREQAYREADVITIKDGEIRL